MSDVYLVDFEKLKANSVLDRNVSNDDIRLIVKLVQDEVIENVIGTHLFDRLKGLIISEEIGLERFSQYRELLDDYLFWIFAWRVPAELMIVKSYKVRNIGTVQQIADQVAQAPMSELESVRAEYRGNADKYVLNTIKFLKCNRECFPELEYCACDWCAVRPFGKELSTPIYFGGRNINPRI